MNDGPVLQIIHCHTCRGEFLVEAMPKDAEPTKCRQRVGPSRRARQCGRLYWHLAVGKNIRQGIDPAWLENTAGGCRAARDPADVDKASVG